ncbi:hypothetical protein NOR51B_2402 [Luminiphilus syltensis NOR5-1B]|uniref:Uncharacterized protein n=1 Tax=Luminiphilus syltensis NOR5-1B TaxID=565045 RepID=B8KYL1_9GAMM|nr:hypothetical protein [Luminiphilus syltensis]EED36451.1 hypothetical protein NOR51B_2402 [Luminiphilus syltensis NOR5-1B]
MTVASASVDSYQPNATGRYSHTEKYLHRRLLNAELVDVEIHYDILRAERGNDVEGVIVCARR